MYLRVKSMAADQESHSGSDSDSETAATSATWITAAVETETSVDSENPSMNAAVEEIGTFRDSDPEPCPFWNKYTYWKLYIWKQIPNFFI